MGTKSYPQHTSEIYTDVKKKKPYLKVNVNIS